MDRMDFYRDLPFTPDGRTLGDCGAAFPQSRMQSDAQQLVEQTAVEFGKQAVVFIIRQDG